ncbi:MAG TPA: hypothetical protein DD636_08585 [Anaerolineaceae bacterium]|nr:hypothetical protein [Anaerolineaceae bacterium]
MPNLRNSAALIVSLGKRLEISAKKAVLAYAIPQSKDSGIMVTGSSLEFSREEYPEGRLRTTVFDSSDQGKSIYEKTEPSGIDQINFQNVKDVVNSLWVDFREHAMRTRNDPERIGIAKDQVLIVADTWDKSCSCLLLPVLYCFKNLVESAADQTDLNVILDISHFESEETTVNQESLVYRLVSEISDRISADSKKVDDPLLLQLGFKADLSQIVFFVIDDKKENAFFAKDHQEIQDIVLSFILGIVNAEVRRDLTQGTSFESLQLNRRFFSSFGSVGMIYDPKKIIDYCGLKLANKIISEDFIRERAILGPLIEEISTEAEVKLGDPIQWFRELIKKPPFSVIGDDSKNWSLSYEINEVFYTPPMIDQAANCSFISKIESYYQTVVDQTPFGALEILKQNARIKAQEILVSREQAINQIYTDARLYPNLFTNLDSVLKFIEGNILSQLNGAKHKKDALDSAANYEEGLLDAKKRFRETLNNFDPPPFWFRFFPEGAIKDFIRKVLTGRQTDVLIKLEKISRDIEQLTAKLISLPYERILAEFNLTVASKTIELIQNHQNNLGQAKTRLEQVVKETSASLELKREEFSEEAEEFDFLFDPVTKPIISELYDKYEPDAKQVALELMVNQKWFLLGKPDFSPEALTSLIKFAKRHYNKVREWDLARVINEFYVKPHHIGQHRTIFANYLNKVRILLTYKWETVGESPNLPLRSALLSADGEDFWPQFFAEQPEEDILIPWGEHISPSPYFASFTQVLNGVSYNMIEHHFAAGKAQWEALSEADKVAFDIIPRQKKKPSPVKPHPVVVVKEPDVVDPAPDLPDGVWSLTCEWDFTPPGNLLPSHFEVSIQVSEAKYTNLLNRDRFINQFQLYAEESCDEIDQLVDHFKKIQSQFSWDSYTQASNVLAFVQCFIPYRRDIETKNISDYARFPLETLWDRVGDCEDVAILCGTLLSRLDFKVTLLVYPGHMAFGVETSKVSGLEHLIRDPKYPVSYYYGESTSRDWRLGQIPEDYHWATPDFYRINESSWLVTPEVKEPEPEPKTE